MVLPYELRSEHEWDPKIPKFPPVTPPVYMGFPRKRETVEDLMLSPRHQIFNRWKVPERLLESAPPGGKPVTPEEEVDASVKAPSIPPTPAKVPGTPLPATPMPAKQKISPAISRMSREMSLPNIKIKTTPVPRVESRNGLQFTGSARCKTPKSDRPMRPEPMTPQRSKTMFVDTRKKSSPPENGVRLNSALLPEAVPQAEEWMKHADKADKKVIERILKMASKKHELENSLKKSLLPDAKDTVEKWMKDANEEERKVALNFFNSLAGGQLMGMTVESQRKRLKEVLNTLEENEEFAHFDL